MTPIDEQIAQAGQYFILVEPLGYKLSPDAEPIEIPGFEALDLFVNSDNGLEHWAVSEGTTGLSIATGPDRDVTVELAARKLQNQGLLGVIAIIDKAIAQGYLSPRGRYLAQQATPGSGYTEPDYPDEIKPIPTYLDKLRQEMAEAEYRAWDSLARYKFVMFGYWAGIWVHLNRISGLKQLNPWHSIVDYAKTIGINKAPYVMESDEQPDLDYGAGVTMLRTKRDCWCGAQNPYCSDEPYDDAGCSGLGVIYCYCSGDMCVCHNHGEVQCPGCFDCESADDEDDYDPLEELGEE